MTPTEPHSGGDWIILDEFVDDAAERMRVAPVAPPPVFADPVLLRVAQLTHQMFAARVEPGEIVRRVLEIVDPSLQPKSRDQIRSVIENQIRSYRDSFTD